ncbi:MAG: hypothetical protein M3O02_08050 [Acidobacteriota bacterium]|nr:hypothetical protein [Acidobacteriota bacterium]
MSLRHPSRTTLRLLKLASLGLAGLVAGLLTGCSGASGRLGVSPNDTGWHTSSTYASATSGGSPPSVVRSAHLHLCDGSPCDARLTTERVARTTRRSM